MSVRVRRLSPGGRDDFVKLPPPVELYVNVVIKWRDALTGISVTVHALPPAEQVIA